MGKFYQIRNAYVHLKNPSKYTGTLPCTLRSGLEINFVFKFLDIHPSVLEWASESIIIPYYFEIDKKNHRYFTDFWMKVKSSDGSLKQYLIEVKPYAQQFPPKTPKRKTKRYLKEEIDYVRNQNKWNAARAFCAKNNMEFIIMTEKDIPS